MLYLLQTLHQGEQEEMVESATADRAENDEARRADEMDAVRDETDDVRGSNEMVVDEVQRVTLSLGDNDRFE